MDCQWHRVYHGILNVIQNEVKNVYGQNVTLYVKDSFDCKECVNKSFIQS